MLPDFTGGAVGKESTCNAGDLGLNPGSGRSPGEGDGNPLQYCCLENIKDRGAWRATGHRVAESWMQRACTHVCFLSLLSIILQHTGVLPRFPEAMGAGDSTGDKFLLPGAYLQSGGCTLGRLLLLPRPRHQGLNASCLFGEAWGRVIEYKQALRPKGSFSQDPLGIKIKDVCIHFRNIPILKCFRGLPWWSSG